MQRGSLQCRFRRLNQRNPSNLLFIALFPKEIRIAHCRHGLPTTVIDDVYFWYLEECLWQMLKSIIEFCLVHLSKGMEIIHEFRLCLKLFLASFYLLIKFVFQLFRQFHNEIFGQIPNLVKRRIGQVPQLIGVCAFVFYHHRHFPVMVSLSLFFLWLS